MAYSKNQNEPKVPISNVEKRTTSDLLPRFYRTNGNKKFLQATLDQLTQPGTVKKLNGYIGRASAKAATSNDIFLQAPDKTRQDYQLEPAAIIKDYLGNTTFFKDYIDHINHIEVFDGNIKNHSRLNKEEFYSWNPHICWDKFVNYQQYYWLPFGPTPIEVLGNQLAIQSTYTVRSVDEVDNIAYLFTPNGLTRNPTLRLFRGQTYTFDIDAPGHPFSIKTQRVSGNLERYTQGVEGYAVEKGTITFTIPLTSPDVLFYVSENAVDTGGVFQILDIDENTSIDLGTDFLGKKTYTVPNGTAKGLSISNGMKLSFGGNVTPEKYGNGFWYVEGVGTEIQLVNEQELQVRTSFSVESQILFDNAPFDQLPFGDASVLPGTKDYITINRSSVDQNPWSRYNRWFHQDVVRAASIANGQEPDLDQTLRATRPIIEFNASIKLHNFGVKSKKAVDVIDNFTTDVFSTIEGTLGYNIDGIDLAEGMRVLFVADTDSMVRNKIFKVNFINVLPDSRQLSFDAATAVDIENDYITFTTEHGLNSKNQVTYLAEGNAPVSGLVNRQVYYVKAIDTFTIELYTNPTLTTKVDIFAPSLDIHKFELFPGYRRQITLIEEDDSNPQLYETVTVNYGQQESITPSITGNQGQTYWYNGTTWKLGQVKNSVNQPPLFDIFDIDGNSYSDNSVYDGSTFAGTKIFSYKVGSGSNDSELGFSLTYQNINNIGDIVFEFNLLKDTFAYKNVTDILYKNTDVGYVKITQELDRYSFENAWKTSLIENSQPVVRIFKESGLTNNFPIDVYNDLTALDDLEVRVYVNGKRVAKDAYTIETGIVRKHVVLNTEVAPTDIVTLRCFSAQSKNDIGYYELPLSLQNNPLNNNIEQFTLGEVIDHVDSIIDNISVFQGVYPGDGNLRDIGNLSAYGTRFVQHSGPMNNSLYHLGSTNANVIKALDQARIDYGKFKRAFIIAATESGIDTDPRQHVDFILQRINGARPKTDAYYLSDMFGYTASNRIEYTVVDSRIKMYPLTSAFNLDDCSNKSINVYLNGNQLIYGRDYIFGTDVFFEILIDIQEDDLIEAFEFESTDGCFCPPTPTKLGLYPKFIPKKYIDDTYIEPTEVIQGHDGSITIAFGDYRDDLLLELETRIFNNIKVHYNTDIFDVYDFIPGYNRKVPYSRTEVDTILSKYFFQWTINIQEDFTKDTWYDQTNSFTYNYRGSYTPDNLDVPAAWRGIYRWLFDTDRPHTNPWECLGFSIEPSWWQTVYGPAPYTSDNLVLWDDIKEGIVREPGVPVRRNPKFAKPILAQGLPVDDQGKLVSPKDSGLVQGTIQTGDGGYYTFGDHSMVETAWRRSSYLPFALIQACLLMQPNHVLGRCLDRSRIQRNLNNQLIYSSTGLRIRLEDIVVPSTSNRNNDTRQYACGLINYVIDYLSSENIIRIDQYAVDLKSLTNNLASRLGAFTNKPKYRILLDSKNPSSSGGVFVPEEDYAVELNVSSAIKKVTYSGVVITKFADGFEVRGYNFDNPYFTYYLPVQDGKTINVGGISESYITWSPSQIYIAGKVVKNDNQYYRVKTNHTSGEQFDSNYYVRLAGLPIVGGRDVVLKKTWDLTDPRVIAYGTKFYTIQDVADFLQGYGVYLEQLGFVFDDFDNDLATITNWETSVKEFLFWSTQNWSAGAVISLSPCANKLVFNSVNSVVGDITDQFRGYSVYRVDGQKLDFETITAYRNGNVFILEPEDTNYGIFGVTLYLLQKEHVVILENKTLFNDTIYDREAGYRQERVKIIGYVTSEWTGGFEIPGFIYDQAIVSPWGAWTDYRLGDIVKHKEFYYSANTFLVGSEKFNNEDWVLLDEKPKSELLPNWDYKAETFTDFYDLDSDNLDSGQQKIAQHLIGYQKRQYLENIIQNDVSQYKFYQGMIIEKGTQNVLNKLFDVLSADGTESLTFDEEWAFRVGEYGSVDTFNEIEFILDEASFKINPQPLELVDSLDVSALDFVYRQKPSDVYIKPANYTSNIWPTTNTTLDYLRTPGYVRKEDVQVNVDTLDDLVSYDISSFVEGDYVWTAFEPTVNRWNIYRFTSAPFVITNVTYSNSVVTVECDQTITLENLNVGDFIGLENVQSLKGFYKVTSKTLNKFTFSASLVGFSEFTESNKQEILPYVLTLQRVSNIDDANDIIPQRIKTDELIWADNNGNDQWTVYKNAGTYRRSTIVNSDPAEELNFGLASAISDSGNIAAISDTGGITIYQKGTADNSWKVNGRITRDDPNLTTTISTISLVTRLSNISTVTTATDHGLINGDIVSVLSSTDTTFTEKNVEVTVTGLKKFTYANIGSNVSSIGGIVVRTPTSAFGAMIKLSHDAYWLAIADINHSSNKGRVSMYTRQNNGEYLFKSHVVSQSPTVDEYFGNNIAFAKTDSGYLSVISAPGSDSVYVYNYVASWASAGILADDISFGHDIALTHTGNILIVSAPRAASSSGSVFVYEYNGSTYDLAKTLTADIANDAEMFGESAAISSNGNYIAVSATMADTGNTIDAGRVLVYKLDDASYVSGLPYQTIYSPRSETNEKFGFNIDFMNDSETLAVFSKHGDVDTATSFDQYSEKLYPNSTADGDRYVNDPASELRQDSITFDNNSLRLIDRNINVGRIDIFDRYNTKFIYGESLSNTSLLWSGYGEDIAVGSDVILVSAIRESDSSKAESGTVYSYVKPAGTTSWTPFHAELPTIDIDKIKKVFLYNKVTSSIVTYLDVIDPIQGKIPGVADQEIRFKTFFDPATYSVGSDAVNVDNGANWTKNQVGMLWWDLTNAKFIDPRSGNITYRSSVWNQLYDTASIDVYEWVETSLLPSLWNKQADTEAGLAKGISGQSKYGDSIYSVSKRYDSISQTFKETYYYWVKNKKNTPNVPGRTLSAFDTASLIADPVAYGYPCIAFTGTNSLSLINLSRYLQDKNIVLNVQYWLSDYKTSNYHSQWKLLSTNETTVIPSLIEKKWFHSLVGKDDNDRVVPNIDLPVKHRYGIEFRPRQSMFVNRIEALKQFIERVNTVINTKLISDDYDLTDLEQFEAEPSTISAEWDRIIDTDAELRFVPTILLDTATVTPVVVNGRIVRVTITNSGRGYGTLREYAEGLWYGPNISVTGPGSDAVIKTIIDAAGQVVDTVILNQGRGYTNDTSLVIRDFKVLVHSDTTSYDTWSIYAWNKAIGEWTRVRSQSYDVRKYWKYLDWYEAGYNQFVKIDFLVENTYELVTTDIPLGSIAKVKNIGSGGWLLLEKFNNLSTIDYTQNFRVIGREHGTVEFLSNLYKFNTSTVGYDGPLFDADIYDNSPTTELKIILNAIKDKILIDEFRVDFLKLFFASVRYALTEQVFIDWAFKTSFVKSMHNVGELKQKVTYNSDNLEFFESYIREVKPYRTKVREYVSNYSSLDRSQSSVTDFDLLPVINNQLEVNPLTVHINSSGEVVTGFTEIDTYPWKHWNDHVGYEIISIKVVDGGTGYETRPIVEISGVQVPGDTTLPASAVAYISNGKVIRIDIVNAGTRWVSTPTITIRGGNTAGVDTTARAVAIIGNGVIRTNYIKIKFDRTSKVYEITELAQAETFTGSGSKTQFSLRWSPDIKFGNSTVTIDNTDVLKDDYTLTTVTSTSRGYTSYSGLLTFVTPPPLGSVIEITYNKNYVHLNALDRINFYYNPTTGQVGKDLAQLMTGIDYGGVQITGLGFGVNVGWDALPWFTDAWDAVDPTFEDYIATVSTVTYAYRMPYVPAVGQEINIYVSKNIPTIIVETIGEVDAALAEIEPGDLVVNESRRVVINNATVPATLYVWDGSEWNNSNIVASSSYLPSVRIDDSNYLTINQTNDAAIMTSFIGDGEVDIVTLPTLPIATVSVIKISRSADVATAVTDKLHGLFDGEVVTISVITPNGTFSETNVAVTIINGNTFSYLNTGVDTAIITSSGQVTVALKTNDRITFRKDTSDGSYAPRADEYDTQITGGNLAYSTASGLAADDIILDGDGLITPDTSHAPEEIVPGHVTDTVAIKVFHRPSGGCPNILFNSHIGDGTTTSFTIGQYFQNQQSVIVKLDDAIQLLNFNYTIDYQTNTVIFESAPANQSKVTILSISFNSANILDLDYFVSDGVTTEYITKASWLPTITSTVLVNGETYSYVLFSTDDTYTDKVGESWRSRAGIRFETAPPVGAIINYVIDANGFEQTASIVKSDTVTFTTDVQTYSLINTVGVNSPLDQNVLVKTGQRILRPASANYFTMNDDQLVYALRDYKYLNLGVNATDLTVYVGSSLLALGADYDVEFDYEGAIYSLTENSTDILSGTGYAVDDILTISGGTVSTLGSSAKFLVTRVNAAGRIQTLEPIELGSYVVVPDGVIILSGGSGTDATISATFEITTNRPNISVTVNPAKYISGEKLTIVIDNDAEYTITNNTITFTDTYPNGTIFEVISFYNHNVLGIERTVDELIPTTAIANGTAEYYELAGKLGGKFKLRNTAISGDFVWVIKNSTLLMSGVDYRLDTDHTTIKLNNYLFDGDIIQIIAFTNTVVHDSFAYMQFKDMLNRVHYKRLNKSKSTRLDKDLTQFSKTITVLDGTVLDTPVASKNLPGIIEINGERIEYFNKVGNVLSQLRRGTLGTGIPVLHGKDSQILNIGSSETIPYKDEYVIKTHTADGISNTYDLPFTPSITTVGNNIATDFDVFVGGYRLKKKEYTIFAKIDGATGQLVHPDYPDSVEGDITLPAEFSNTPSTNSAIKLTATPELGAKIVVVKKQGKLWNDLGQRLAKSDNSVSNFLKTTGTNWVESYLDKYEDRVLGGDGNPLQTGDGEPLEY